MPARWMILASVYSTHQGQGHRERRSRPPVPQPDVGLDVGGRQFGYDAA